VLDDSGSIHGRVTDFYTVSWGGVRLSPLGTSATDWSIVPGPDDEHGAFGGMTIGRGNKYSEKTCSSVILSAINST
jgi:hypothetical protein